MQDTFCSMIHAGLVIDVATTTTAGHCCLRSDIFTIYTKSSYWQNKNFEPLRDINKQNKWSQGCSNCKKLEESGQPSMRSGMNQGLGIQRRYNLSGPARIDLMFDISCNLACRSCGTHSSTFWQKHLKQHNEWPGPITATKSRHDAIAALQNLDLSNLKQLVFCGGETLLGNEYWAVAEWLVNNVPNAKNQLTLCFQTNGTQSINKKHYDIIDRCHLVKLHISLDGVGQRFDYLRWPADWNQVTSNILEIKKTAPSNMMFVVEETISIFNLYYQSELQSWVKQNFLTNREGDVINHTRHLVNGIFNLGNCTQEYIDALEDKSIVSSNWTEHPEKISKMIQEIKKFDVLRNQNFSKTFPEVAEFYRRYL